MNLRAWPNRFEGLAMIGFDGAGLEEGALEIIDPRGRRVRTLRAPMVGNGPPQWTWDGRDERGRAVAWGIYFLHLRGLDRSASVEVLRLR